VMYMAVQSGRPEKQGDCKNAFSTNPSYPKVKPSSYNH
jgi:hypothetical protein